jgi:hypothetical protein
MRWMGFICLLTAVAVGTLHAADPAPEKLSEETAAALKQAQAKLAELKAEGMAPRPIVDRSLERAFPGYGFAAAHMRQFPVARLAPEGLGNNNLFILGKDGKLELLMDGKALEKFFKTTLPAIKEDAAAADVARAWVRLSQEFRQDGFLEFKLQDDSTKVTADGKGRKAQAKAVLMAGGNGELGVVLTFDEAGKLTEVTETAPIKSGVRPVCQATKLLDPDPIVRAVVRRDLLIMGRHAREYLLEQRAKASPELQKAIDQIWEEILAAD